MEPFFQIIEDRCFQPRHADSLNEGRSLPIVKDDLMIGRGQNGRGGNIGQDFDKLATLGFQRRDAPVAFL